MAEQTEVWMRNTACLPRRVESDQNCLNWSVLYSAPNSRPDREIYVHVLPDVEVKRLWAQITASSVMAFGVGGTHQIEAPARNDKHREHIEHEMRRLRCQGKSAQHRSQRTA